MSLQYNSSTLSKTSGQMIVTLTIEQLSSIVEDASEKGALKALEQREKQKENSELLSKEYLTIKQVCSLLGISRVTVNRWVHQGKLQKKYINGLPRFATKDIKSIIS